MASNVREARVGLFGVLGCDLTAIPVVWPFMRYVAADAEKVILMVIDEFRQLCNETVPSELRRRRTI